MPIGQHRVTKTAVLSMAALGLLVLAGTACTATGTQASHHATQTVQHARPAVSRGIWHSAREVPGTAALNKGGNAQGMSISCPSAGNCSATGLLDNAAGTQMQPFVVNEVNGTWHTATRVPGLAALGNGASVSIGSVSWVRLV